MNNQKDATTGNVSALKARLLQERSSEKRANFSSDGDNLRTRLRALSSTSIESFDNERKEYIPYEHKQALPELIGRGVEEGVSGTLNLGWGLGAGAAAIAESVLGKGGLATKIKESTARKFMEGNEALSERSLATDSLTYSWNKAKEGDFSAMVDWAAHGTGYVASQLASILVGSGVISAGTQMVGKKAITQVMGGMVRKEAERIATAEMVKTGAKTGLKELATSDAVLKKATSSVANRVGNHIGMGSMSFSLEGGDIMGDLAQQSIDRDKPLSLGEVGKGLTATAAAAAVEYMETLLSVGALKGKLGKFPGAENISNLKGKVARTAITGTKVAPAEAAQEFVQTGIEQWGKGQDLGTEEARIERIDAAGVGALGGGPTSVGGLFTRSKEEQKAVAEKKAEKAASKIQTTPETQPDYKEKVEAVAESGDISEYTDPKKKESNSPLTAIKGLQERSQKEDISLEDKIKSKESARTLFDSMNAEKNQYSAELLSLQTKLVKEGVEGKPREATPEEAETLSVLKTKESDITKMLTKAHPIMVAMLQEKQAPTEEVLSEFRKAFTEESTTEEVQRSIRKIYGSNGGMSFLQEDGDNSIDVNTLLTEHRDKLAPEVIEQLEQVSALKKAINKVTAKKVNTDILTSTEDNGFKSIPDHLQEIASAIESGDLKTAQTRQGKLQEWAEARKHRATVFSTLAQAYNKNKMNEVPDSINQAFKAINEKQVNNGLKEYYIGASTLGLSKTMLLEANALKQAVKAGQGMFPSKVENKLKQEVKDTLQEVETEQETPKSQIDPKKIDEILDGYVGHKIFRDSVLRTIDSTQGMGTQKQIGRIKFENENMDKKVQELKELGLTDKDIQQAIDNKGHKNITQGVLNAIKNKERPLARETINGEVYTKYQIGKQAVVVDSKNNVIGQPHKGRDISFYLEEHGITSDSDKQNTEPGTPNNPATETKKLNDYTKKEVNEKYKDSSLEDITVAGKQTTKGSEANSALAELYQRGKLKEIGYTDAALSGMSEHSVRFITPYIESTLDEIIKEGRKHKDAPNKREALRGLYRVKKANQKETETKPEPKKEIDPRIAELKMNDMLTQSDIDPDSIDPNIDEYTKLQLLQVFGITQKDNLNIFNQSNDVIKHIEFIRDSNNKLTDAQRDSLTIFIEYAKDFSKSVDSIFKTYKDYGYRNPMSYLAVDGVVSENVKMVMAYNSFNWITTEAGGVNLDREIIGILGLKKSTPITSEALELLGDKGNKAVYLADTIGRNMFKDLQISFHKKAPTNMDQSMAISMGLLTLANLQNMGLLERHYIDSGIRKGLKKKDAIKGLAGLANKLEGKHYNSIRETDFIRGRTNSREEKELNQLGGRTVTDDFYSRVNQKDSAKLQSILEVYKDFRVIEKDIFKVDRDGQEILFEKKELSGKKEKLAKSDEVATLKQTENKERNDQIEYAPATDLWNIAFNLLSLDYLKRLAGKKTYEGKHKSNHVRIDGVNNGIDRSFDNIETWQGMSDAAGKTTFYIPSVIQANIRMRQVSLIQAQNDKIHRALFAMKSTVMEVNPKDSKQYRAFIEAVGQGFGIEVSKEESLDATIQRVKDLLTTDVMQEGLEVVGQLYGGNKLTTEQEDILAKAVDKGGEDLLSFKSLVEYHKYMVSNDNKFTTDIFMERDGMANGPFMMMLQLSTEIDKPLLTRLMSTGLVYEENVDTKGKANHKKHHDPYESIGDYWGKALEKIKKTLLMDPESLMTEDEVEDFDSILWAEEQLQKIDAIHNLLGAIEDKTALTEHSRKISKNLTTGAIYGQGEDSVINSLVQHILEGVIPDALENIAQLEKTDKQEAQTVKKYLTENIRAVSGVKNPWVSSKETKTTLTAKLSKEALKGMRAGISNQYGKALFQGMEKTYGSFRRASKALNKGIGILAARYNAALEVLVGQIPKNTVITKEMVNEIRRKLKPLLPKVKTPMGGYLDLFDFTGEELLEKSPLTEIMQRYNSEEIPGLNSRAAVLKALKASGVKPVPTMIHMLDGMTANGLMGEAADLGIDILNAHDAAITGIHDSKQVSDIQNRLMYENMSKYHVAEEIQKTIESTLEAIHTMIREGVFDRTLPNGKVIGVNINTVQRAIFNRYKTNQYHRFGKEKTTNTAETDTKIMIKIANVVAQTKAVKEEILKNTAYVNQYMNPEGGHKTGNKPGDMIEGVLVSELTVDEYPTINTDPHNIDNVTEVLDEEVIDVATDKQEVESDKPKKEKINNNFDMSKKKHQPFQVVLQDGGVSDITAIPLVLEQFPGIKFAAHKDLTFKSKWTISEVTSGVNLNITATTKDKVIALANKRYTQRNVENSLKSYFGSSRNSDLSTDPVDYAIEKEINSDNLVQEYNAIKNDGPKKVSPEHDAHLKRILANIVQSVIQPLDLFTTKDANRQTEGAFISDSGKKDQVFISTHSGLLGQGVQMSTGEVYSHELVHSVIHFGLDKYKGLYNKAVKLYQIAQKKLSKDYAGEEFRVFLNDPNLDITDAANAEEVQMAQDRYEYLFVKSGQHGAKEKNAYTGRVSNKVRSNHIDEFATFGVTNENFGKFLRGIALDQTDYAKSSWSGIKGANIQDTLLNIFQAIMNAIRGRLFNFHGKTAYSELESLVYTLAQINTAQKTKRFEKVRKYVGRMGWVSQQGNRIIKGTFNKVTKADKISQGIQILKDRPDLTGQVLRDVINKWESLDQGILKSTIQEIQSVTDRLAPLYRLLSRRRLILDASKEATSHAYKSMVNGFFKKELTTPQKDNFTKAGLKPDASAILDSLGQDKLLEVYKDQKVLQSEVDNIFQQLRKIEAVTPYLDYYKGASLALGQYMITSTSSEDDHVFLNARNIAELIGTENKGKVQGQMADDVTELLDQLISLYAISKLPKAQRAKFASLMEEDTEGVVSVLRLHQILKETARETSFAGDEHGYLFKKGYTKTILNPEKNLVFGTLADEAELLKGGYTRSQKAIPRDPNDPNNKLDVYIYTSKTGRMNNWQSGIVSLTQNRASGTDTGSIADQYNQDTATGLKNLRRLKTSKKGVLKEMSNPNRKRNSALGNSMIAQVDRNGNIIDYRYMMSESVKDNYLDQVNQFDEIIGAMASQIVDKGITPKVNTELVDLAKVYYDEGYQNNPAGFLEIGPDATDPALQEMYYMLPDSMRKYITKVWGPNKTMYIPKDVAAIVFGFRKYSLVEAFAKKPGERAWVEKMVVGLFNGLLGEGRGIKGVDTTEKIATELAQYAKDNIIVKSLIVTLDNFGSNLVYLRAKGVPVSYILKHGWEAIKYGTKFQADSFKANKLAIERKVLIRGGATESSSKIQKIDSELMQLEDALARNPVMDSIDSGLMPHLVDEVDTQGQKNLFPGMIEGFLDKRTEKVPDMIKATGRVAFITQDTQAYKVLNNAVKMTDFVGRHILYNHYIQNEKVDPKEAAAKAIAEYINFDIPSHRITEYGNQIGLLRFTKYGLRIPMVAAKSIVEKPFDALMSYVFSSELGLDNIYNSVGNIEYKIGTPWTFAGDTTDDIGSINALMSILR